MDTQQFSKRLGFSYVFDWIVLIAFAAAAAVFSLIPANRRPFSLSDPAISFPYRHDTISIRNAGLGAVLGPAIVIVVVSLLAIRAPNLEGPHVSRRLLWRRRLWEWHTGWLGLGLSVVLAFFITQGMKNLFGKPRPDFLERCKPDIANRAKYVVSGYEQGVQLLSWEVCLSKNGSGVISKAEFEDGFRSFPSGHCSISFAGLVYLSFFLAAKFAVTIPWLNAPTPPPAPPRTDSSKSGQRLVPPPPVSSRRRAAAPPLYLLTLVFIPIGAAIFIASTRFTDYKHAGFDVLFSSLEGMVCAWFGFRWYHLPIRRGAGWSWGPRCRDRAFGIGVGVAGYVAEVSVDERDLECGGTYEHNEMNDLAPVSASGKPVL